MTNIMIMLVLLCSLYLLVRAIGDRSWLAPSEAAAWGAAALFMFTGMGHFVQTEQLTWMLPDWVPRKTLLVYLTGILEFAIAAGLIMKKARWLAGVIAIAVLIIFFPASVYAAFTRIPMSGNEWGPIYLLVRGPVQVVIIAWIYWFVVRNTAGSARVSA